MQNYDFDFLDLRNDKSLFLLYLIQLIESQLLSNSTNIAVSGINFGTTGTNTTNSTELVINFSYIENLQVEEKVVIKEFWNVLFAMFKKPKYQTVIYKNFKKGKLILFYNDNLVSDKWKPSKIQVVT